MRFNLNNGLWAFGTGSYAELFRKSKDHTLDGYADKIAAPTLIMDAENDLFLKGEPATLQRELTKADTTLVTLAAAESAGEHTHAGALARAHQVIVDWLDTTFKT